MITNTTMPLAAQPTRLPSESAIQPRHSDTGTLIPLAAATQHPVAADEQMLLAAQGKVSRLEYSLAEGRLLLQQLASLNTAGVEGSAREGEQLLQALRANGFDRKVNGCVLSRSLQGLAAMEQPVVDPARLALRQALQGLPQARSGAGDEVMSDQDLWNAIADAIGNINDNYLDIYEDVVAKYTEFYQAFSDILGQLGELITAGGDSNSVKLKVQALWDKLNALKNDYKNDPLFQGSEAEAKQWAEELGLPPGCVQPVPGRPGEFQLVVDMGPIDDMLANVPGNGNGSGRPSSAEMELNNAAFQAWQSGFKAQEENLKNTLQTLTQKYSNANSLFDNLVKVLSSTISSCTETCKTFLQV